MQPLKITTVGASVGVILNKEVLHRLGVKKGDSLYLSPAPGGWMITPYDPEFVEDLELAEIVNEKYRNALKELAK